MPHHQFQVEGRRLFTWCAWDTLFMPELIQKEASVISIYPQSRKEVQLRVGPGEIIDKQPDDIVVSSLEPDAMRIRQNVIINFCHFVYFLLWHKSGRAY
jgi:alkylmercury lyase